MKLVDHQNGLVDETTDPPGLRGGACSACGSHFFPFQTYGCERCGAAGDALRPYRFAGEGTLLGAATVRHHMGRPLEQPFVVARVLIEPGVAVRALLTGGAESARPGTPVTARLVVADAADDGAVSELRFEVRT